MKFKFYYAKHKITGEFIAFTTSTTGEGDIFTAVFLSIATEIISGLKKKSIWQNIIKEVHHIVVVDMEKMRKVRAYVKDEDLSRLKY